MAGNWISSSSSSSSINGIWMWIFQNRASSSSSSSSSSSAVDFWRDNINGGGWATIIALALILVWHSTRFFLSARSRSTKPILSPPSTSNSNSNSNSNSISRVDSCRISGIVTDADLKNLIDSLDEKLNANEKWDNVINKSNTFLSYEAKCCKPKDGPLKYSSLTVFENCTTEMLRDFYMDNDYRLQWDKTLVEHFQLQLDKTTGTEIGRTIKKFPLLTPREYILAWRLWEAKDKTFYCFIKECEHPSAPLQKKYVRVKYFKSGWRIRKVPGRNACEIKMVHQEDAGLNVEMAKLAFSKGIWSYVCKMDNALRKYSDISRSQQNSVVTALSFIQKVPPELDIVTSLDQLADSATNPINETTVKAEGKKSRRPSKKLIANGLLLLGGVVCLSRGHSTLGAKVAMAFILTKLSKRGASSSQRSQINQS